MATAASTGISSVEVNNTNATRNSNSSLNYDFYTRIRSENNTAEIDVETDNPNAMFVCGLSVYPAARRRGLATTILHEVESLAIDNEVNEIRLSVEKPKTWIRDLYIRRGYELVDENDEYYYLVKYV
jgi:ribosomal protein S18 acetylase RimI-like enzyme